MAAFYTRLESGTPVLYGLLAGFVTALIFVLHIVQPPYNIHPGILGLAVNVAVLLAAIKWLPRASVALPVSRISRLKVRALTNRVLFATGCALLALANWPLLTLSNRVEPFVLGLPFFVFVMLALNLLVGLLLFVAYQVAG